MAGQAAGGVGNVLLYCWSFEDEESHCNATLW